MINLQIENLLKQNFKPLILEIYDDSLKHAGHREIENSPYETHFSVLIVSEKFSKLSLVQRHRQVYKVLASLMNSPIHALSLQTYSPSEYQLPSNQTI